ncbi:ferredoxin [Actinomadura opuntiae]|uniref:ferredoxin n=1 Tax=Actinomadura sp. OS1-43 TaxID=604315 RepID=UPI00255B021B|nr:ferredoxin [Actinomadura sp. OS1-43]MDL4820286.1 ferredoxin [Actinomadura sp. OS1-43]
MRVIVDYDQCDGNGLCSELAPEIFELGGDDVLRVREGHPGPELWQAAEDAAQACPKLAITLTERG